MLQKKPRNGAFFLQEIWLKINDVLTHQGRGSLFGRFVGIFF